MMNFFYNLFLKFYFSKSFLKTKKDANYILAFQDELISFKKMMCEDWFSDLAINLLYEKNEFLETMLISMGP